MTPDESTGEQLSAQQIAKNELDILFVKLARVTDEFLEYDKELWVTQARSRIRHYPSAVQKVAIKANELYEISDKDVKRATSELKAVQAERTEEHEAHEATKAKLEQAEQDCEKERNAHTETKSAHEGDQSRVQELESEQKKKTEALNALQQQLEQLQQRQPELELCRTNLEQLQQRQPELEQCRTNLTSEQAEHTKTNNALKQSKGQMQQLESDLGQRTAAYNTLTQELEQGKANLASERTAKIQVNTALGQSQAQERELVSQLNDVNAKLKEALKACETTSQEMKELQRQQPELQRCKTGLAAEKKAHSDTTTAFTACRQAKKSVESKLADLQRESDGQGSEIRRLKSRMEQNQPELAKLPGLQSELTKCKDELAKVPTLQKEVDDHKTKLADSQAKYAKLHDDANLVIGKRDRQLKAKDEAHLKELAAQKTQFREQLQQDRLSCLRGVHENHLLALSAKDIDLRSKDGELKSQKASYEERLSTLTKVHDEAKERLQLCDPDNPVYQEHLLVMGQNNILLGHQQNLTLMGPAVEVMIKAVTEQYSAIVEKNVDLQKKKDNAELARQVGELHELYKAKLDAEKAKLTERCQRVEQLKKDLTLARKSDSDRGAQVTRLAEELAGKSNSEKVLADRLLGEYDSEKAELARNHATVLANLRIKHQKRLDEELGILTGEHRGAVHRHRQDMDRLREENESLVTKIEHFEADSRQAMKHGREESSSLSPTPTRKRARASSPRIFSRLSSVAESVMTPRTIERPAMSVEIETGPSRRLQQLSFEPDVDTQSDVGSNITFNMGQHDNGASRAKAEQLLSMFYVAWGMIPDEKESILSTFNIFFGRGRMLGKVVEAIDYYCRPNRRDGTWPPGCLAARVLNHAGGKGESMAWDNCPFCQKKRLVTKICLFAKSAPGLNGAKTVSIDGQDVRWILKKRRATAADPVEVEWRVGGLTL